MVDLHSIGAGAFLLRKRDDGVFVYADVNPALERVTGMSRDDLVGKTSVEAVGPAIGAMIQSFQRTCASRRVPVEYETPVTIPRGAHCFQTTLTPLLECDGGVLQLLGITVDISARKRLENELKTTNLRLNLALEALGGANWSFDAATQRFDLGPSFDRILGGPVPRTMALEEWQSHVVEEDLNDDCFADILSGKINHGTAEFRVKASSGETRWLRCKRRALSDGSKVTGITGVVVDITSEKRYQAELNLQASSDALTGLANRRSFDRELAAVRSDPSLAVLMIDVDQFKSYNDNYGHIAGDAVLKFVAALLASAAGDVDGFAARYGGEEFAILIPGFGLDQAAECAKRIIGDLDELALPHAASAGGHVTVSIGVSAGLSFDPLAASDLVAAADRALYRAKSAGRGCFRLDDADRRDPARGSSAGGHDRARVPPGARIQAPQTSPMRARA